MSTVIKVENVSRQYRLYFKHRLPIRGQCALTRFTFHSAQDSRLVGMKHLGLGVGCALNSATYHNPLNNFTE